ncbi:MAG: oligopeptidase A, partial [Gammaproteobacteria bacterium]|nr:oligopeptidase A [Gammaproteobacteria bacterium]
MNDLSANPLLGNEGLPRFSSIRADHVEPAVDATLAANRVALEKLIEGVRDPAWENFVQPIEDMNERFARLWSPVSHLNAVMNNDALRAAYNACLPKLTEYWTALKQDERLYRAYKAVAGRPDFATLSEAQRKIIENVLRDFRLSGAELNSADKQRFKEIEEELSTLQSKFEENVLDATNAWERFCTDEQELAGLPETALAEARAAAEHDGKPGWKLTLHMPSYLPVMMYADSRALRRELYEASSTRASELGPHAGRWDNAPVMQRILQLRAEKAGLLGFANFAALSVETKMAESTAEVLGFLNDLVARSRPAAQKEFAELRAFAAERFGVTELEAWDIPYYSEKLRQERYAFSEEDLRPYFPEPQVLAGLFDVVRRLYGLDVREVKGVELWHPDARFFEIRDAAGVMRGRFYLDLYARPHKRGGAWMDDCIARKRERDAVQVPVAYLVCNFSAPIEGRPALFSHDEVTTLFHEFGHGLHHMLTLVDYAGVAGINGVKWDAVELPSQFMENWCWEKQALDVLAKHYETGAPLPDDLYRKMIAARNFQSAMQMVRQLEFSIFDMRLHGEYDPNGTQTIRQLVDEVRQEVAVVFPPAFNRFANSFGHIFAGGYAAGYYSYKWAEVLSADAFSKFEENGVFDRKTGEEFLHNILEQGGVREPMDMFIRFRGRKPTIDALLR